MDFPTQYTKASKEFVSVAGTPDLQEYEYTLDKAGIKQLVMKDSKIDVYSRIQADYESTDINLLMQRFALGDSEALDINKGFYLDARDLPKTYAEVFQRGLEAEQYFDGLPVDLKEMFDNSHTVFYSELGTKAFDEKVNKYNDRFVNHQFDVDDNVKSSVQEEIYHE